MTLRIRHLAHVNPSTPAFDALPSSAELTFMPLETVWADGRLDTSRVAVKGDVGSGYVRFQDGDVIVPKTAPTFQHARATVVNELLNGVGAGSSELHLLRPRSGADARFLAYVARSAAFVAEGVTAYQGVAGLQRVPADFVADWPVPTFSHEEQRRIADFLDDQVTLLDKAIDLRRLQVRLTEERFGALLERTVGEHRQQRRKLAQVLTVLRDGTHTPPPRVPEGVPMLTAKNVRDNIFRFTAADTHVDPQQADELDRSLKARAGDLLLSIKGTVGNSAIVPPDTGRFTFERNLALLRVRPELCSSEWLQLALRSRHVQDQIQLSTSFSAQPGIYLGALAQLQIPLPSRDVQDHLVQDFGVTVRAVLTAAELASRATTLQGERKQALITAAVTGQFDVTTARAVA